MKNLLPLVLLLLTTSASAGFFGGLDIDEITNAQEKAFQAARSCANGSYLDACDDLIKHYRLATKLLSENENELFDGINDGNSSYRRVVERARRLQKRVDLLIR